MARSVVVQGIRMVAVDFIGGVFGFPFWWYTKGLVRWGGFVRRWFDGYSAYLGVGIWVRNLFVPMYGSYSIVGRLISFFMRLVMIVIRGFGLVFLTLFCFVLFLMYLVVPILVIGMIVFHLVGLGIDLK